MGTYCNILLIKLQQLWFCGAKTQLSSNILMTHLEKISCFQGLFWESYISVASMWCENYSNSLLILDFFIHVSLSASVLQKEEGSRADPRPVKKLIVPVWGCWQGQLHQSPLRDLRPHTVTLTSLHIPLSTQLTLANELTEYSIQRPDGVTYGWRIFFLVDVVQSGYFYALLEEVFRTFTLVKVVIPH